MATPKSFMSVAIAAVAAFASMTYARQAQAAFLVTMEEVGSDVVLTGNGSLNISALTLFGPDNYVSALAPSDGGVIVGSPAGNPVDLYSGYTGPTAFGSGGSYIPSDSGNGDKVGVYFSLLVVPDSYVSGDPLSDMSTYTASTFASLGVTPGTYVWSWGSRTNGTYDTFTLQIGTIPEPATSLLLGVPLAATMLARRRAKVPVRG